MCSVHACLHAPGPTNSCQLNCACVERTCKAEDVLLAGAGSYGGALNRQTVQVRRPACLHDGAVHILSLYLRPGLRRGAQPELCHQHQRCASLEAIHPEPCSSGCLFRPVLHVHTVWVARSSILLMLRWLRELSIQSHVCYLGTGAVRSSYKLFQLMHRWLTVCTQRSLTLSQC